MTQRAGGRAVYLDLDGTLLGPGGSLFAGEDGTWSDDAGIALRRLRDAGVPIVLVSGRSRARLEAVARLIGAHRVLPELGAPDCGYPTRAGEAIHEAISRTGILEELLAREHRLEEHPAAAWGREASLVLRGIAAPELDAWVRERSAGTLQLADNGRIGPGESHVYHLLPAGASKAAAVTRDLAERRLDPTTCLMVGDSGQDLDIGATGVAVALVRNGAEASPELAARAAWITRGAYATGVREAVEAWLDGRTTGGSPSSGSGRASTFVP
jgi:phosphoglycolate phosphatase